MSEKLIEALRLIADTDCVDAILDPQRLLDIAREALAFHTEQPPSVSTEKLHAAIMNLPCKPYDGRQDYDTYCRGHRDARHAAAELVSAHAADQAEPVATVCVSKNARCKDGYSLAFGTMGDPLVTLGEGWHDLFKRPPAAAAQPDPKTHVVVPQNWPKRIAGLRQRFSSVSLDAFFDDVEAFCKAAPQTADTGVTEKSFFEIHGRHKTLDDVLDEMSPQDRIEHEIEVRKLVAEVQPQQQQQPAYDPKTHAVVPSYPNFRPVLSALVQAVDAYRELESTGNATQADLDKMFDAMWPAMFALEKDAHRAASDPQPQQQDTQHSARITREAWQPIETAPKDGRRLLLTDGIKVGFGKWLERHASGATAQYWFSLMLNEFPHKPTHWLSDGFAGLPVERGE